MSGKLIASAVREGRKGSRLSIRELARRSGISPAQINRLQAGQVPQPSMETLVKMARALDRNPNLLFAISGHVRGEEARVLLERMFRDGSELVEEWKYWKNDFQGARQLLADPATSEDAIRQLALEVFLTPDTEETQWQEAYLGTLAEGEQGRELRELIQQWAYISAERRKRVVDFVHDQAELSRRESIEEMREEKPDYGRI